MKVIEEKRFVLTKEEYSLYKWYLKYLLENPLPCWECPALSAGKCHCYHIGSTEPVEDESCGIIKKWFEKIHEDFPPPYKNPLPNDKDFIKLFENEYRLERAKKQKQQSEVNLALAEVIYNKNNVMNKISMEAQNEETNRS